MGQRLDDEIEFDSMQEALDYVAKPKRLVRTYLKTKWWKFPKYKEHYEYKNE